MDRRVAGWSAGRHVGDALEKSLKSDFGCCFAPPFGRNHVSHLQSIPATPSRFFPHFQSVLVNFSRFFPCLQSVLVKLSHFHSALVNFSQFQADN